MDRRLVVGDIHGAHKALAQVLERSEFDYENDFLITIGDVCDGWPETKQCVDELIKVKNKVFVVGNHDLWMIKWIESGDMPDIWVSQGGKETIKSYGHQWFGPRIKPDIPKEHKRFWTSSIPYYLTEDNKLFVHGGFPDFRIDLNSVETLAWNRSLWGKAKILPDGKFACFDEIFIGHTTTERESLNPVRYCNVWNVDQGAGWGGRLTLMDIDTKEFWSSDIVKTLYAECGR